MELVTNIYRNVETKANTQCIMNILLNSVWEAIMTNQSQYDDQVSFVHINGNAIKASDALESGINVQKAAKAEDQELFGKDRHIKLCLIVTNYHGSSM